MIPFISTWMRYRKLNVRLYDEFIDLCNAISKKFTNTDGQSGIYACGDGSLELSLKQEKECLVD